MHQGHQAQNVQVPIETKIHPRREPRMQSSSQAGSHRRPAVDVQGPGQPGNARKRQRRGAVIGGNPESKPTAQPRGRRPGEPDLGTAGRSRESRETWKESIGGATARARKRGNPRIQTRWRGRARDSRQLDDPPAGITGRLKEAGRPAEPVERLTWE